VMGVCVCRRTSPNGCGSQALAPRRERTSTQPAGSSWRRTRTRRCASRGKQRRALDVEQTAAAELRTGSFDAKRSAVLGAAGHRVRAAGRPAGLTARSSAAAPRAGFEQANSPAAVDRQTVGNHAEHIYANRRVVTRGRRVLRGVAGYPGRVPCTRCRLNQAGWRLCMLLIITRSVTLEAPRSG
jgi:hypothetical protein